MRLLWSFALFLPCSCSQMLTNVSTPGWIVKWIPLAVKLSKSRETTKTNRNHFGQGPERLWYENWGKKWNRSTAKLSCSRRGETLPPNIKTFENREIALMASIAKKSRIKILCRGWKVLALYKPTPANLQNWGWNEAGEKSDKFATKTQSCCRKIKICQMNLRYFTSIIGCEKTFLKQRIWEDIHEIVKVSVQANLFSAEDFAVFVNFRTLFFHEYFLQGGGTLWQGQKFLLKG